MSTSGSGARLEGITRDLFLRWLATKESWRDAKADEFERKYLQELRANVDSAVTVIAKLDKLLTRIKKDCE